MAWVNTTLGDDAPNSAQVLSDFWPHGEVSQSYGVLNEDRGMSSRSLFVIDTDGMILDSQEFTQRGVLPDVAAAVRLVANLD